MTSTARGAHPPPFDGNRMEKELVIPVMPAVLTVEAYLRPNRTIQASLYMAYDPAPGSSTPGEPATWSAIFPAWDACRKISTNLHSYLASMIHICGGGDQEPRPW